MKTLVPNVCFFTLLLFCAYIAFAQWRLSKYPPLRWYIGYLLFTVAHYGRDFWIVGASLEGFPTPPDPPLQWNSPLSYAAFGCYFMFLARFLSIREQSPSLASVLVGVARFHVFSIVAHLLLQIFAGNAFADRLHQALQLILAPVLCWLIAHLTRHAHAFQEKLILIGSTALVGGFLCAVATRHWPWYDSVPTIVRAFSTPWGGHLYWYHLKVGVAVDVVCFSWALALRQRSLLTVPPLVRIQKEVVAPLSFGFPEDVFLNDINAYLAQHYADETLSVAELAHRAAHLGPDAMTRKIKEKTDLTTEQYILRYRLERALEMLQTTDASVGAISVAVGLKETAHFSRTFKRHYGQTPSEMRRYLREKSVYMQKRDG